MSINPVPPMAGETFQVKADPHHENQPTTRSAQPDSGRVPEQNSDLLQNAHSSIEMPEDEVQVQRDSEADGVIVVKYLDHSGNLIVQVPSSQVLSVMRGINQDFQAEAKVRSSRSAEPPANQGEKTHGH
jgi:uncharacterized FlaG/YvyC family protein